MGLAERLDVAVFSSAVGKRKPHPLIFQTALDALERLAARTRSSSATAATPTSGGAQRARHDDVQAYWFVRRHGRARAGADYDGFTPMDVLSIVRRLTGES